MKVILEGVNEYCEGMPVELAETSLGRLVIRAKNECGYNGTDVDLLELIAWLKKNRPDMLT